MRNKRLIIALLAAVTFGLIAAVSVKQYLLSAQTFNRTNDVVVAKVEIPVGSRIIPEQLTVAQFPADVTPEGAIAKIDDHLIGRVVLATISPRDPVTEGKLAQVGALGGLSSVIPEGYRAMTVKVDDVVGVSGFIMPGTLVDVVVVITPPKNGGTEQEMISKIVLQNIKVLANGQNIDKPKNDREVERSVKAVTLQVTPEQAEKLALASSEGKLQLVMRNSIDQADEQTSGANKKTLLLGERAMIAPDPGLGSNAAPAKAAPSAARRSAPRASVKEAAPAKVTTPPSAPRPTVEVIEGAKKKTVDFPS
jgi:pilus assembly protein CpaB